MRVEISPTVYLALCGLVKDALEVDTDASPLLQRAAVELAAAIQANGSMPPEVARAAETIADLAETARAGRNKSAAA